MLLSPCADAVQCSTLLPVPGGAVCEVLSSVTKTLLRGDVLFPDGDVYYGGNVLIDASGAIECIGCGCNTDGDEDTNSDGVKDPNETDPCLPDTYGDGLQDGAETGVNMPVADPDDGEPMRGTNLAIFIPSGNPSIISSPLLVDSDGDGAPDDFQVLQGTDPLNPAYPAFPQGDVNTDGKVNTGDVRKLLRMILQMSD